MAPKRKRILVIDDEKSMRHMLRLVLEKNDYFVVEATTGKEGLKILENDDPEAVLCDIRMPEMNGLEFLQKACAFDEPPTIIMMSAFGTIDTAIECMKKGAYDYISKPFKPDEVVLTLRKAEERLSLQRENKQLREELGQGDSGRIVYRSDAMAAVLGLVDRVADSSTPILITGETGTGKELIARALHDRSARKDAAFVAVNCSAIAASLMESELFGHARGAFTGADRSREGLFASADGGTLFLDEVGELPLELQPKLLRVLQESEIRKVGDTRSRKVNVRILAATGKDLKEEVAEGRFRDDLFYRLDVMQITVPPLRERPEDIKPLAEHFLSVFCRREGRTVPGIREEVLRLLQRYEWPGNIRELRNFMEKALIFCRDDRIDLETLPPDVRRRNRGLDSDLSLKKASERMEREYIEKALAATGGNRTHAARLLEISLRSLLYKMKTYDIGQE
ncbi:MAG TPA: sigma-54 dependent transcriptional regulator [Desulfuromonadales bacterium]|nr:sigma-54 dependent transcriptional regulator [Desulfuromonadales bacterium]